MPNAVEISVHDNHLTAYTVQAKEKRIIFHTELLVRERQEYTDVIFEEVLAYHFENDLFGTILFDIPEAEISDMLEHYSKKFEEGWRQGWPRDWEKNKESIAAYIGRLNMRCFKVWSSYGMDGWVLAKSMRKIRRPERASTDSL